MSRSRKKHPVISIACHKAETLAKDKRRANRKVRRCEDEIADGNAYRRIDERWNWTDDGKQYWDDPKAYRK